MNQKDQYTEKLLKDRIEQHTFEFSEDRWDAMASMLESQPQPVASPWSWFGFSLNSIMVLIAGAGTFLLGLVLVSPIDTVNAENAAAVAALKPSLSDNIEQTQSISPYSSPIASFFTTEGTDRSEGNGTIASAHLFPIIENKAKDNAVASAHVPRNEKVASASKSKLEPQNASVQKSSIYPTGQVAASSEVASSLAQKETATASVSESQPLGLVNSATGKATDSEMNQNASVTLQVEVSPGLMAGDQAEYQEEGEAAIAKKRLPSNLGLNKNNSRGIALRDINRGGRGRFRMHHVKGAAHIRRTKKGLRWGNASHQFNNSQLFNIWDNPAYVGVEEGQNLIIQANRSWLGMYRPKGRGLDSDLKNRSFYRSPTNYQIGYYGHLGGKHRTALGIYVEDENQRLLRQTRINASISHKFSLSKKQYLSFGLNVAYTQNQVFFNELYFPDQVDPRQGVIYNTLDLPVTKFTRSVDFSLGMFYSYRKFYAGAAINQFVQPRITYFEEAAIPERDLQREVHMASGFDVDLSKKFTLSPSATVEVNAKGIELNPGSFVKYNNQYMFGLSYRNLNVVTAHAGWLLADHMRLLVAVGTPTQADLLDYGRIAYMEAGLRYQFGKRTHKTSILVYD